MIPPLKQTLLLPNGYLSLFFQNWTIHSVSKYVFHLINKISCRAIAVQKFLITFEIIHIFLWTPVSLWLSQVKVTLLFALVCPSHALPRLLPSLLYALLLLMPSQSSCLPTPPALPLFNLLTVSGRKTWFLKKENTLIQYHYFIFSILMWNRNKKVSLFERLSIHQQLNKNVSLSWFTF